MSSREQEREGFSIPAQRALLKKYAADNGFAIVEEFIDVETAKKSGRASFTKMLAMHARLRGPPALDGRPDERVRRAALWGAAYSPWMAWRPIAEKIAANDPAEVVRSTAEMLRDALDMRARGEVGPRAGD